MSPRLRLPFPSLAQDAKWLAEEKRREAIEEANDVTKRADLSGFYSNLLNRNEAFGCASRFPSSEEDVFIFLLRQMDVEHV